VTPAGASPYFGNAIVPAGDVNGDGFGDLAVTAPAELGTVYVYRGTKDGPSGSPVTLSGTGYFGSAVTGAGDVDGDGLADVLVGAPGAYGAPAPAGTVSVFFGTAGGIAPTPTVLKAFGNYGFALRTNGAAGRGRGRGRGRG
jgi:hypothetical protein